MTFPIQVGPAAITINRDDRFLVCQADGRILGGVDDGFFTRDTRLISGYDLKVNGRRPLLLNSAPLQFFSARFEYTNDAFLEDGGPVARQSLAIRVDRTVGEGVHEDIDIVSYARRPIRLIIEIDGREFHTDPEVFESDRSRQNLLVLDGWRVLRFTTRRGRADVPETFLRTRRCRRLRDLVEPLPRTRVTERAIGYLPAFPTLRRTCSPAYRTPLPL